MIKNSLYMILIILLKIILFIFIIAFFLGFLSMTIILFKNNFINLKLMLEDTRKRINNKFGYGHYFDLFSFYIISPIFVFIFWIIFSIAYSIFWIIIFILFIKINIIDRYWKKN